MSTIVGSPVVALGQPLAALRAWSAPPPDRGWWHWVVGVDPTGRVMLPADAWRVLGAWGTVGVVTLGTALVSVARREMVRLADLVGALRLPAKAFAASSGTEVVVDLLVLRRRPPGAQPEGPASTVANSVLATSLGSSKGHLDAVDRGDARH